MKILTRFSLWVMLLVCGSLSAQKSRVYTDRDRAYTDGLELYKKEKYSAAVQLFSQYLNQEPAGTDLNRINARFYKAVCGFELQHPDAEAELIAFTEDFSASVLSPRAWFYLGRHYYRQKEYRKSLSAFEKTDLYLLNGEEVPEYYFKTGYAWFNQQEYNKANQQFAQILNVDSKYQTAALYYSGHIAYNNDNYITAIETFKKLDSSATFGNLVPYYITQIQYEQGKYTEAIGSGSKAIEQGTAANQPQINRIVAESHFKLGNFTEAARYLENYKSSVPVLSLEDEFLIGYCQYKAKNYAAAIPSFERASGSDSLSQSAYYHLADCFLKTNNKNGARTAFQYAASNGRDSVILENSAFEYAKLNYELNYQPVAIKSFRDFLQKYPDSKHAEESSELLARLYLSTRNYKDAFEALDKLKNKGPRAKEAYQKVAYYRGVELYNDGDNEKCIPLFEKAIINDFDPSIRAQAMYWKAEALYRRKNYDAAVKQYRIFLFNPASVNSDLYPLAQYNLGYAHFKQNNYEEAQTWFRKYLADEKGTEEEFRQDALLRTGDCLFALRQFDGASDYYNRAYASGKASSDYALFQKGMINGLQGNLKAKSSEMQKLLSNYPGSIYRNDALYEKGRAEMSQGNYTSAISNFDLLLKEFPSSKYTAQAQLNKGLILYNEKNDEAALSLFKEVIQKNPGSPLATEALISVKNIYVEQGKPDEYFAYVKTIPNSSISKNAQDSITYEAAEQRYLKGEFNSAENDFSKYLNQFPQGQFRLNALFYRSECLLRNGRSAEALAGYEEVAGASRGKFTEKSLLRTAELKAEKNDCAGAISYFKQLEESADLLENTLLARAGLMRCYYHTQAYTEVISYSAKIEQNEKSSESLKNESRLYAARSHYRLKNLNDAQKAYQKLAGQSSAAGAEARYSLAQIAYDLSNYKQSKDRCFELIKQVPSYDYWVARSFILLSDNYIALADTFQAKHTLMSLLENYERDPSDPEDIRSLAQERYDAILAAEKNQLLKPEDQTVPERELIQGE